LQSSHSCSIMAHPLLSSKSTTQQPVTSVLRLGNGRLSLRCRSQHRSGHRQESACGDGFELLSLHPWVRGFQSESRTERGELSKSFFYSFCPALIQSPLLEPYLK
jgi:hypothetical protein